ncbi:MAG: AAA family ATPase [Bacilli bacterium]|nr:AAA family ATPase [Bacilli bacterium]
MKEYSYDLIFNKLVNEIPINKSDKVYGITFIAGPGYGKSTVASMIAKKLNLYITANDKIRRLYDKLGFDNVLYEDDIKKMANDRTVYLLKNKTSHIIDANMEFFWQMATDNYQKYNAKLIFIELVCDENEILKRIDKRAQNYDKSNNLSRAGREDFYKYLELKKEKGIPKDKIFYKINTNCSLKEIEKQVDLFINKLKKYLSSD